MLHVYCFHATHLLRSNFSWFLYYSRGDSGVMVTSFQLESAIFHIDFLSGEL
jgi:hypothetical protein